MHIIHPSNFISFMLRLKKWTELSARTKFSLQNTGAIKKALEDCPADLPGIPLENCLMTILNIW